MKALSHTKSKDKNFRIMKKTVTDKRTEETPTFGMGNLGMIMITGLGQQHANNDSSTPSANGGMNLREQMHLPPRMRNLHNNRRL
jgi:hypothetical protein